MDDPCSSLWRVPHRFLFTHFIYRITQIPPSAAASPHGAAKTTTSISIKRSDVSLGSGEQLTWIDVGFGGDEDKNATDSTPIDPTLFITWQAHEEDKIKAP